jgi:hypothetical protein
MYHFQVQKMTHMQLWMISKDMSKIVTKQKYLNFVDRRKTITFNFRIIDGHIGFPYCRLFFDKSNERSIKLETAVTWSKSNLNMMNIYEESTINFWIWPVTGTGHRLVTRYRYRSRICHRLQVPITDLSPVTGADHWLKIKSYCFSCQNSNIFVL